VKYEEYCQKTAFDRLELLAHANGTLIEGPQPEMGMLPAPPMLMIDRIVDITHEGSRGRIIGEQDVSVDAWYFWCHFRRDPVQPGCLGIDAVWQLLGFYLTLRGAEGVGRALGCREVDFFGQIRPHNKIIKYDVEVRRCSVLQESGTAVVIGSARILVDDKHVYTMTDAKVGAFKGIRYHDYPHRSPNSYGGPSR
jgi:3-hydroxyacyl-[acyl-carrier protein] dehydratase / trans-2-decenoyl-[acyl-carrier protein] isomerase